MSGVMDVRSYRCEELYISRGIDVSSYRCECQEL